MSLKSTSLLIFLLIFSTQINSQGLKFGVHLDPQISWLVTNNTDLDISKSGLGLNGGLIVDNYFAKNYAFTTGISISTVSSEITFNDSVNFNLNNKDINVEDDLLKLNLQYLKIPVGLKFKTREFGYSTFYVQLGLTPEVKIKSQITNKTDELNKADSKGNFSAFNLGYHFGGGVLYSMGENTSITAGIIYNNGFLDTFKNADYSININTISLRVGLMF